MKKIIILFLLLTSSVFAKDIKLSQQSADKLIIKQSIVDTIRIVSIEFKSKSKKFKYECDSTDLLTKDNEYAFDYSKLTNYHQEIIYQATIKYIAKNGKVKSEIITIFNDSERINPRGEAMQCLGTTKKGNQCSRTTTDPSGYCWQHR